MSFVIVDVLKFITNPTRLWLLIKMIQDYSPYRVSWPSSQAAAKPGHYGGGELLFSCATGGHHPLIAFCGPGSDPHCDHSLLFVYTKTILVYLLLRESNVP